MKKIAITTGDPAGIGPEIVRKSIANYPVPQEAAFIIYGEKTLPPGFSYIRTEKSLTGGTEDRKKIMIIDNPGRVTDKCRLYAILISESGVLPGRPDESSGRLSYKILERVVSDIKEYKIDGLVTSPVSKAAIRPYEPSFIGHTEYLAEKFGCQTIVMNFVSSLFDVALLTTHASLAKVTEQIREEIIIPKLRLIHSFSQKRKPGSKTALLGLNPHCGEEGAFGSEEEILRSALTKLHAEGIVIDGPFPADSFFRYQVSQYRQVIACYHDQGLIPFKMTAKDNGVNVTLGLPFLRTSVDHGTAYNIAGKGIASTKSMISALDLAVQIICPAGKI